MHAPNTEEIQKCEMWILNWKNNSLFSQSHFSLSIVTSPRSAAAESKQWLPFPGSLPCLETLSEKDIFFRWPFSTQKRGSCLSEKESTSTFRIIFPDGKGTKEKKHLKKNFSDSVFRQVKERPRFSVFHFSLFHQYCYHFFVIICSTRQRNFITTAASNRLTANYTPFSCTLIYYV